MTEQPTQEQIKKFWERCKAGRKNSYPTAYGETVYPELDLNNLFKYAAPKLDSLTDMNFYRRGELWKVDLIFHDIPAVRGVNADPALALFWAIWEVIK